MSFLHKLFKTDLKKQKLVDISVSELLEMGVSVVALDADNTSSHDRTTTPLPGTEEWISSVKNSGIKVVLLSNAKAKRAGILASQYDIPVIGMACKPLPFGYIRTILKFRTAPFSICMIGDQLFTDVLGANLMGFKSIYVFPTDKEVVNAFSFAVRRFLEKNIFAYQDRRYK